MNTAAVVNTRFTRAKAFLPHKIVLLQYSQLHIRGAGGLYTSGAPPMYTADVVNTHFTRVKVFLLQYTPA